MIRYLMLFLSLLVFSCSEEDDSHLKQGKVAADLEEADALTKPYSSIKLNDGASATNQESISIAFSANDVVSLKRYAVTQSSTLPATSSSEWTDISEGKSYSTTLSKSIGSDEGNYTYYGWSQDKAENYSTAASASIIYDVTAPTNPSISINSGATSTTNTHVSLTLTASDSTSGVSSYFVSESSTTPSSTSSGWVSINNKSSITESASYSLTAVTTVGTHQKTVYAWFKDEAGNISSVVSDSINLIVYDTTPPSAPSLSINSGSSTTTSSSVTLSISASDDIGVTGYYLSQSSSTPSSSASGWTAVSSSTYFSASVSYTLSGGNGTNTVYVWFKDAAGNVSSSASDTIIYSSLDSSLPNIYCGLSDSSTAGNTSLSATKLTSGTTRTAILSSSTNNYYFFFTASSSSTYNISWEGNAWEYSIYKGVGNRFYYSYSDKDNITIQNITGNIIIKFDPDDNNDQVSFSVTEGTIIDYHQNKNYFCQISVSGSLTSSEATLIELNKIYQTNLYLWSKNYYYRFNAESEKNYQIIWSGNASNYTVFKNENQFYESSKDDDNATIRNFDGEVIIKFKPSASGDVVDFMIYNLNN